MPRQVGVPLCQHQILLVGRRRIRMLRKRLGKKQNVLRRRLRLDMYLQFVLGGTYLQMISDLTDPVLICRIRDLGPGRSLV